MTIPVFRKPVRWCSSSGRSSSGVGGGGGGGGGGVAGILSRNSTDFYPCLCFTSLGVNESESYTNRSRPLLHEEASNLLTLNCK